MTIEKITTTDAPAAIGPYSQAIRIGDLLAVQGQKHITGGDILGMGTGAAVHFRNIDTLGQPVIHLHKGADGFGPEA